MLAKELEQVAVDLGDRWVVGRWQATNFMLFAGSAATRTCSRAHPPPHTPRVRIIKVDTDEEQDLASQLQARVVGDSWTSGRWSGGGPSALSTPGQLC